MKRISLGGEWTLYYYPQNERRVHEPADLKQGSVPSVPAAVPGNVELDLVKAGQLPDPFFGDNVHLFRPYEQYEWWYEKQFRGPDSEGWGGNKAELVFGGTDCLATYWLNGTCIGQSDNMFIEHRFDISGMLRPNAVNTLHVRISSPIVEALNKTYDPAMATADSPTNWESIWIRKASHSYAWDIMPRVVSAGLWRDVELHLHNDHEIRDLYIYAVDADESSAKLRVYFEVDTDHRLFRELSLMIEGRCGASAFGVEKTVYFKCGSFDLDMNDPVLWWPMGYGDAALYEVTARLKQGDRILAERKAFVGIRKAELIRTEITSKERPGEFLFKINGVPIYVKGSNWVPADAFHSRDAGRIEPMLDLFRDLKCNMVRCWGGNVYEDHPFYEYCDRHGIMVWQDFAMACTNYPQVESFYEQIREEAFSVVRKLRVHPSIVLWSGDNECDQIIAERRNMDPATNKITREVLPQVVAQCDPLRPYLQSSPYYAPEVTARNDKSFMPEQHLWGPRDYYKSRFYQESTAHFISEIGYHGCPNLSAIRKFIDEEQLWPWQNNAQWITHASESTGKDGFWARRIQLMADQIKEMFGVIPETISDFILASQFSQAEAKKFFIEMVRTRKPRRTGVLWWNVIDGWPQFSDAVVDYYYGKKLAYYYIQRVQQPVCVMVDEPERWHVKVIAGNDSNQAADGTCRIWDADTGETLLERHYATKANENSLLGNIRVSHGEQRLFLIEYTVNGERFGNHYLLGKPPFSLDRYRQWLGRIAGLPGSFDAAVIGK